MWCPVENACCARVRASRVSIGDEDGGTSNLLSYHAAPVFGDIIRLSAGRIMSPRLCGHDPHGRHSWLGSLLSEVGAVDRSPFTSHSYNGSILEESQDPASCLEVVLFFLRSHRAASQYARLHLRLETDAEHAVRPQSRLDPIVHRLRSNEISPKRLLLEDRITVAAWNISKVFL